MVATPQIVEIEIDDPTNANLYFRPLMRTLRGRFDLHRVRDDNAMKMATKWPDPIPGHRIALDFDKREAAIIEPLHGPDQAANRRRIASEKLELPLEREVITNVDVPTFVHWMRLAVESNVARVVSGEFRAVDGKPKLSFFSDPPVDTNADLAVSLDRLATAMAQQTQLIARLIERDVGSGIAGGK
jgi:hypothetical protein